MNSRVPHYRYVAAAVTECSIQKRASTGEAATVDAVIERRVVATALCRRAFWVAV